MNLGLTDKQYKHLLSLLQEQADAPAAEPEKGTSDKQAGGQGYPQVGKWESGVTRGPGNQVGVTKWADVVGAKLNRGKANPLKEQVSGNDIMRSRFGITPTNNTQTNTPKSNSGVSTQDITKARFGDINKFTFKTNQEQPKQQPKQQPTQIQSSKITNEITQDQYGNDYFTDGQPMTYPHYTNGGKTFLSDGGAIRWRNVDIKDYPPEFWKGKDKPNEPQKIDPNPKNGSIKAMVYDKLSGEYVIPYGTPNKTLYKRPGDKDNVWRHSAVNNKFYRTDLNNWYLGNLGVTLQQMENFVNRKTDSGIDVPKGFNPKTYSEYLSKRDGIQNQIDSIEDQNSINPFKQKTIPQNGWDPERDRKIVVNLKQQLVNLKNQYQNPNFSYGLDSKSQEQYDRMKKELDDLYLPKFKILQNKIKKEEDEYVKKHGVRKTPMAQDATRNVSLDVLKSKQKCEQYIEGTPQRTLCELQSDYDERRKKLDFSFGKDDWSKDIGMFGSDFDEWWDKWGGLVQIGGNILFLALGSGLVTVVRGGMAVAGEAFAVELASSGTLKAVSPYVMDSIFNGTVGAYQVSRKQDTEALMSFVCALVPFISFGANVGKVSVKTSKDLSLKIAKLDLDSQPKLIAFVETLSQEEKSLFRDVYNLPRQAIKEGLDRVIEDTKFKLAKIGYQIEKPAKSLWWKNLAKSSVVEGGLPLSAGIANALFNVIKNKNITNFGIEELTFIQQSIKKNLESLPPEKALVVGDHVIENLKNCKNAQDIMDNVMKFKELDFSNQENVKKLEELRKKLNLGKGSKK